MFIGEYVHTIDTKRRLAIPAKFRKEFGGRGVLTRGLDSCLFLYSQRVWEELAEKLGKLPVGQGNTRQFIRLMLAGAFEVGLDNLGRILIPEYLKAYAGLGNRVIITGVYNRLEIWEQARWNEYRSRAEESTDEIAERLGELGVY